MPLSFLATFHVYIRNANYKPFIIVDYLQLYESYCDVFIDTENIFWCDSKLLK